MCERTPDQELNLDLLVRHPAPFPTESLLCYILHLTQENGYPTPSGCCSLRKSHSTSLRCATGGLIGYLTKVFRQAIRNAVAKKNGHVTLADLYVAHHECTWHELGTNVILRPFSPDFRLEATTDVVTRVLRIGSEVTPPASTRHIDRRTFSRRGMHA
jgi:hypothetical protein